MLKRDRSNFEKQADRLAKAGMMRLGGTNPATETPTPYPYVLAWDRQGRKGQRCRILRNSPSTVQIEFEDGHKTVINRLAIRRT